MGQLTARILAVLALTFLALPGIAVAQSDAPPEEPTPPRPAMAPT